MELIKVEQNHFVPALQLEKPVDPISFETSDAAFMAANTEPITLESLKSDCIIPVFAKDNESTISHQEFIQSIMYVTEKIFSGETILKPAIRVSHPIKGRIPEAMGKPAKDLQEHEKTLYFERMAFVIEIPSLQAYVGSNRLNLTLGGVRAYNLENLYSRKSEERFKIFIGYQNKVCTNLCVSTDGLLIDTRARTIAELAKAAYELFDNYNAYAELDALSHLPDYSLSETKFAQLVGRAKMYQQLHPREKVSLPAFPLADAQLTQVVREYYKDANFGRDASGNVSLWQLMNLFTEANKSTYIDSFLDRSAYCTSFALGLQKAIRDERRHWFLS